VGLNIIIVIITVLLLEVVGSGVGEVLLVGLEHGDIAMRAIVVRNGQEEEILARELVAGDIVIVEEGRTTIARIAISPLREATTSAACFSWYQPTRALSKSMRAIVVRNGQEEEILARELVAGDIVIVEEGTVIPRALSKRIPQITPRSIQSRRPAARRTASSITVQ
jgi:magnesium-transporting ATPase (P-type)